MPIFFNEANYKDQNLAICFTQHQCSHEWLNVDSWCFIVMLNIFTVFSSQDRSMQMQVDVLGHSYLSYLRLTIILT